MASRTVRWLGYGVSAALLATTLFVAGAVRAQDELAEAHPAHIHVGTCAELGDVVVPLADVTYRDGEFAGPESAHPVKSSLNLAELPLQEIIDGGHAINIHESAEEIDRYIACGDIGGVVVDDLLVIGLLEQNDSGHHGVAVLQDNGDGTTDVWIHLIEPEEMADAMAGATDDAASPAADAGAADATGGEAVAATIADFAYSPNPLEVAVGSTVTWSNDDSVPHTVTGIDKDALQSGTIDPGATFEMTFDEAGTMDYYCEFHANMKGSIVVQ